MDPHHPTDLEARRAMVQRDLSPRGIQDPRVLAAFELVPREFFIAAGLADSAYQDVPLPIGDGKTISQPYIVAYTAEALRLEGGERVLEIGTGSGYAAAILGQLASDVYTVERNPMLAARARQALERLGLDNVHVLDADGTLGWPDHAPYDAIVVSAGGPQVPPALLNQLALGGRLVMPVGGAGQNQRLVRVTRARNGHLETDELIDVRFVPLIGAQGWPEESPSPAR